MLQPTQQQDRILSLDLLRGFAVLGILIMNIQSFALPSAAYFNPTVYGDLTGLNKIAWFASHIIGDQKFMTIFSLLYGAGIVLITTNAENRTGKSAGLHYKRTFWLLIIGLIHAHLIWHGDILVPYALCGFIVYLFRRKKPMTLVILGTVFILVHTVIYLFFGLTMSQWPPESLEGTRQFWAPSATEIAAEISAVTGNLQEQISHTSASAIMLETFVFFILFLWRAGGLMLVGMGLYKWGILTGKRSKKFYRNGFLISWLLGLPIIILGLVKNFENGWSMEYSMYIGSQFNYIGSLFFSFGLICLVMLWARSNFLKAVQQRMIAVGQMALSNYLLTSVICVLIFYGIGLGLFGQVSRIGLLGIMVVVWIILMLWSSPWLRRYYFGPAEWLWRSLTYGKKQPFGKS